jgi:hypothetical protein
MKLYEFAPARSIRVRWTLQELGVPFEAESVNLIAGAQRCPEFLKINPAGKIPALVDGDLVLTNSCVGSCSRRPNSSNRSGAWRAIARATRRIKGCQPRRRWRAKNSPRWRA